MAKRQRMSLFAIYSCKVPARHLDPLAVSFMYTQAEDELRITAFTGPLLSYPDQHLAGRCTGIKRAVQGGGGRKGDQKTALNSSLSKYFHTGLIEKFSTLKEGIACLTARVSKTDLFLAKIQSVGKKHSLFLLLLSFFFFPLLPFSPDITVIMCSGQAELAPESPQEQSRNVC